VGVTAHTLQWFHVYLLVVLVMTIHCNVDLSQCCASSTVSYCNRSLCHPYASAAPAALWLCVCVFFLFFLSPTYHAVFRLPLGTVSPCVVPLPVPGPYWTHCVLL